MYDQFLSSDYQQILFKQYHQCQQGNRTIVVYVEEFQELRARNDLNEIESQEVLRFIIGLREPIRCQVEVRNVKNFPKATTLTTRYEPNF